MALDLRPRYKAPSVEDYRSSRGADPLVTLIQSLSGGFQQGQQQKQVNEEKKRKQDLAKGLQDILTSSPNPQHKLLAQAVNEDTAEPIATKLAAEAASQKAQTPTRDLFRDPKTGLFTDQPIQGQQPYPVSPSEAVNALGGQNKQDEMQKRLDEMIKARQAQDAIRNDNMAKNRIARLIIAQYGRNFKADKANMENVIKAAAGLGFNLTQDDVLQAYQGTTGEKVTPSKSGGRVKVSNFSVTP